MPSRLFSKYAFIASGLVGAVSLANVFAWDMLLQNEVALPSIIVIVLYLPPMIFPGWFILDNPLSDWFFFSTLFSLVLWGFWPMLFAVITYFLVKKQENKVL
jgi:hypothetical protein